MFSKISALGHLIWIGAIAGAIIVSPFALYISVIAGGTMAGGLGWQLGGTIGARIGAILGFLFVFVVILLIGAVLGGIAGYLIQIFLKKLS